MWKYVKAAILARPRLGPLGNVPVNVLAAAAFGAAGIAIPAIWLVGAGVLTLVVFGLATSERFRKVVDADELGVGADQAQHRRQELVATLESDARERLAGLQVRSARIMEVYRTSGVDPVVAQSSRDALERLEWIYLKLLIAQRTMRSQEAGGDTERQIRAEIETIDRETKADRLSPSARESRLATRELLGKRLENAQHRRQSLEEIESDLQRIEAQVDLAFDDATLRGRPAAIGTNIQLASQMLDTSLYGASLADVEDLDASMGMPGLDRRGSASEPERPDRTR